MRTMIRLMGPAVGALLLSVSLASGAEAAGSCSAPNFCMFENNEYNEGNTNHWRDIVHNDSTFAGNHWRDGNGYLTDDVMDDEVSSVKNRTGCTVRLYRDDNYTGLYTGFGNGSAHDDPVLGNNRIRDNEASSALFMC